MTEPTYKYEDIERAEDHRDFLRAYALACARLGYVKPECVDDGQKIWEKIEEVCAEPKAEVAP
jgi:hypothetical protein